MYMSTDKQAGAVSDSAANDADGKSLRLTLPYRGCIQSRHLFHITSTHSAADVVWTLQSIFD